MFSSLLYKSSASNVDFQWLVSKLSKSDIFTLSEILSLNLIYWGFGTEPCGQVST